MFINFNNVSLSKEARNQTDCLAGENVRNMTDIIKILTPASSD